MSHIYENDKTQLIDAKTMGELVPILSVDRAPYSYQRDWTEAAMSSKSSIRRITQAINTAQLMINEIKARPTYKPIQKPPPIALSQTLTARIRLKIKLLHIELRLRYIRRHSLLKTMRTFVRQRILRLK